MTKAFLLGFIAGSTGQEREDNPYSHMKEYNQWDDGWKAGENPFADPLDLVSKE